VEAGGASAPSAGWAPTVATHLRELRIKDFALVAEQRIHLHPGLTVITGACHATGRCCQPPAASFQPGYPPTHSPLLACFCAPAGESGSGKSVLVEALGQLLGATAFDEAVRPPATTALVEGTVAVAPAEQPLLRRLLGELGVPARAARDLNTLILRRELSKGKPAAAGTAIVGCSFQTHSCRLPCPGLPACLMTACRPACCGACCVCRRRRQRAQPLFHQQQPDIR
jgi:hypothetical protein